MAHSSQCSCKCANTLPAGEQVSKCQTATKAEFQSFMGDILLKAPKRKETSG